jgi:hypothetical protein
MTFISTTIHPGSIGRDPGLDGTAGDGEEEGEHVPVDQAPLESVIPHHLLPVPHLVLVEEPAVLVERLTAEGRIGVEEPLEEPGDGLTGDVRKLEGGSVAHEATKGRGEEVDGDGHGSRPQSPWGKALVSEGQPPQPLTPQPSRSR